MHPAHAHLFWLHNMTVFIKSCAFEDSSFYIYSRTRERHMQVMDGHIYKLPKSGLVDQKIITQESAH